MQTVTDRASERVATATASATGPATGSGDPVDRVEPAATPPRPGATVLRGGAAILLLRAFAMGPAVIVSIGFARLLGKEGFGAYQTSLAWLAVLGVPAGLGVEKLLVQRIAAARGRGEWAPILGLLRVAFAGVVVAAALTALLAGAAAGLVPALADFGALWLVLATLPAMVLLRLVQATLQGFENVVTALVPELVLVPLLSLSGLGVAWFGYGTLSIEAALAILLGANALALGVGVLLLWRHLPWAQLRCEPARYELGPWLRAAAPLLLIGGLQVLNARTDVVMLGALAGASEVGPYGAALRIAGLIALVLVSANSSLAPAIARHHAAGERAELQAVMTRTVRFVTLLGGIGAAVMIVAATPLLSVFGAEFTSARGALVILALAQFISVAMSAPGLVLMMTGHGRLAALGLAGGAVVNIGLNALLIPVYGALGAALASAAATLCWTGGLAWLVRRRLGLDTTVLGLTARPPEVQS